MTLPRLLLLWMISSVAAVAGWNIAKEIITNQGRKPMSDMEKAVEGGEEFMKEQAAHVAEVAAAEEARRAANPGRYPRVYEEHTQWVDNAVSPEVTFVGTQFSYNTEAEALARIDEARANGKYVMYMDPGNASYVATEGADDHRVTIED